MPVPPSPSNSAGSAGPAVAGTTVTPGGALYGQLEERLKRRFRYEHALTLASQALRQAKDFPTGLNEVLRLLLEASQSDRVYIWENVEHPELGFCCTQTYECCRPGITPQIDNPDLQNLPYSAVSPSGFLLDHFLRREPVRGPVSKMPEAERQILEMQQIIDILILPIFAGEHFWGFLGFDDCTHIGNFDDDDVALLQNTADVIGWHVAARRANAELEQRVAARTAELAARNSEMRGLLDAIPDTVLVCDRDGLVLSTYLPRPEDQPAFIRTAADGRLDVLPCVREVVGAMHAELARHRQSCVREFDFAAADAPLSLEARATPVGDDRMLVLLRDISARRQTEREVAANLNRERQLSEMKAQFVAVASHEFRTPLTAAIASVEMLERYGDRLAPEKRNELTTRMRRSLDRLAGIMQDITNAHLTEAGRVDIAWRPVDLAAFFADLIREAEETNAHQHRFQFELRAAETTIRSDPERLFQIFSSLLANATRFSPAGTAITVGLDRVGDDFVVTIRDEGLGILEADRERIFEPFVRGGNVVSIGGLGLGLTIVKRHTERLGGRVAALPSTRGATLEVRLPAAGPAE